MSNQHQTSSELISTSYSPATSPIVEQHPFDPINEKLHQQQYLHPSSTSPDHRSPYHQAGELQPGTPMYPGTPADFHDGPPPLGYDGGPGSYDSHGEGGGNAGEGEPGRKLQVLRQRMRPFESQLLDHTVGVEKPWMTGPSSKPHRLSYWLFLVGIFIGLICGAYIIYTGYAQVPTNSWCSILDEDFSSGSLSDSYWQKEVRLGGTDVKDFTWFTSSDTNSYIKDSILYLLPTLTSDVQSDLTSSVTLDGCTASSDSECSSEGSDTKIIEPVQSAMITTRGKVSMKYGRVEVTAKMPKGDWLWPRISLVPVNNTYGAYPASGLIDIFETRGNEAKKRTDQLNNEMVGGLHWGPDSTVDKFYLTQALYKVYRNFFSDQFYTFGVDWTEDQIFIWVNSRVRKALNLNFKSKTFYQRGEFGTAYDNGTIIANPWESSENQYVAPFDQEFYLRIMVAAGGMDGFWDDAIANKPWQDDNTRGAAMKSFNDKQSTWYPTWPNATSSSLDDRAMQVKSIKMWNICS